MQNKINDGAIPLPNLRRSPSRHIPSSLEGMTAPLIFCAALLGRLAHELKIDEGIPLTSGTAPRAATIGST